MVYIYFCHAAGSKMANMIVYHIPVHEVVTWYGTRDKSVHQSSAMTCVHKHILHRQCFEAFFMGLEIEL